MEGCAKAVYQKCKDAGVTLTTVAETYPYKKDPHDTGNIRIAVLPSMEELKQCAELFALCVKLASVEKFLENK